MMMSDSKIYFQTWEFCWRRMLYYLLGMAAFTGIVILSWMIATKFLPEESIEVTVYLGLAIGTVVFSFIALYGAKVHRVAQIASITEGIVRGNVPQPEVREGLKLVDKVFPVTSPIKVALAMIKKQGANAVKSYILFTISRLVPFLGTCVLSWAFANSDDDPEKSYLDGTELFYKNIKKLGIQLIIYCAVIFAFLYGLYCLCFYVLEDRASTWPYIEDIGRYAEQKYWLYREVEDVVAVGVSVVISVFVWYVVWVFIKPIYDIKILRNYHKISGETKIEGIFYEMFGRMKERFRKRHKR